MIRTYRFRVYPTDEQKAGLSCSFGSVRYFYNAAFAYRCKAYERRGESISYCGTVKLLNKLKASICSILSILLAPPCSRGVLWNMHSQSSAPDPIIRTLPYSIFLGKS